MTYKELTKQVRENPPQTREEYLRIIKEASEVAARARQSGSHRISMKTFLSATGISNPEPPEELEYDRRQRERDQIILGLLQQATEAIIVMGDSIDETLTLPVVTYEGERYTTTPPGIIGKPHRPVVDIEGNHVAPVREFYYASGAPRPKHKRLLRSRWTIILDVRPE